MRVQVRAHSPMQVPHLWRAGRAFPTDSAREIEILDSEDDPPKVERVVVNPTTKRETTILVDDPDKMGQRSYRVLMRDDRFSIHEVGGVDSRLADAQLQAARQQMAKLAAEVGDLSIKLAGLKVENERLVSDHAAEIEALRTSHAAEIAAMAEPPANEATKDTQEKAKGKSAGK